MVFTCGRFADSGTLDLLVALSIVGFIVLLCIISRWLFPCPVCKCESLNPDPNISPVWHTGGGDAGGLPIGRENNEYPHDMQLSEDFNVRKSARRLNPMRTRSRKKSGGSSGSSGVVSQDPHPSQQSFSEMAAQRQQEQAAQQPQPARKPPPSANNNRRNGRRFPKK
jgi:hypothetical protein